MKKDAFYFPHDSNATRDPKLSAFRKKFGFEGLGIWWCLIELMHEQGGKFEKFDGLIEGIAFHLSINEALLKQIFSASINEFRLFREDDKYVWSDRVQDNLRERLEKRLKKVEAGRIGGIESGKKRSKTKQNEAVLEANEPKERKGKKNKDVSLEPKDSKPPILVFPTIGKTKEWGMTEKDIQPLKEAFPSLDILAECRKALAWVMSSPDRRKTARGMGRYLFGWMGRARPEVKNGVKEEIPEWMKTK